MNTTSLNTAVENLKIRAERCESLSISEILSIFESLGSSVAAALLALPFLQPLPLVGLSTPLGLAVALSGLAIFRDRPISLPNRLGKTRLSTSLILKKIGILKDLTAKLEVFFKNPQPLSNGTRRWLGATIIGHGLLLALPLPIPFSNTIPAWTCCVAALSVLFQSQKGLWLTNALILVNLLFWGALTGAAAFAIPTLVETWR